jgi:hypothetical protein
MVAQPREATINGNREPSRLCAHITRNNEGRFESDLFQRELQNNALPVLVGWVSVSLCFKGEHKVMVLVAGPAPWLTVASYISCAGRQSACLENSINKRPAKR